MPVFSEASQILVGSFVRPKRLARHLIWLHQISSLLSLTRYDNGLKFNLAWLL
jgi:hypothetical protein